MFTLVRLASINAFVAAFHLIPLPPLDGGQIVLHLLPPDWAERLAAIRPYGFMIAVMAAVGILPLVLLPFYGILGLVINLS
jgi:Zn-dependent protease